MNRLLKSLVTTVLVLFALMARDSPRRRAPSTWRDYAAVLREPDTLWFSFLYNLTLRSRSRSARRGDGLTSVD